MTLPQFERDRCVTCRACINYCQKKSIEALKEVNYRPARNERKCIGCGKCVLNCPMAARTRSKEKW